MRIHLFHRSLIAIVVAILAFGATANAQPIEVEFWHGFTGTLGENLEGFVAEFNASQTEYQVNPSHKGSYPDTMIAAIAAFRAGNAPHIVQMFEVGTATMMYAEGAVKPVYELFEETGVAFDPDIYIPAIKGYYSLPDGRMMSMPLNSSTPILWVNDDALQAAGLDPATTPLETWPDVRAAAKAVVDAGAAPCGVSFAWPSWTQYENFSAWHDVPLATLANGMEGLGAELMLNSPLHVRHLQNLIDMQAEGSFTYGGRTSAADPLFSSGECSMLIASSGLLSRINRESTFAWSARFMPYYEDVEGAPRNSIIGGASLWVMQAPGRSIEEYRGVAEFFSFISTLDVAERYHLSTGYLPIRFGVFEKLEGEGYYVENPGRAVPYLQLTLTEPTENSRGLRLGNMPEIRDIILEEIELAMQGQKTAQAALDSAAERGNVVLRRFESIYR